MKRIIFHVDVNSAFLSWEATRRVSQGLSDIRNIPSAIGGDRDKRRGVILAKSIPAKKYGVVTGEPVAAALRKCPSLFLAKPDFKLYSACSRSFMSICRDYTPQIEQISIDECFMDMSGMERLYPDIIAVAYQLKDRIKAELGFTVNVGIGSNKLLAKTASDFEKPDRVHTLFEEEIPEKLWVLPIRNLLTVGVSTAEKLERACIRTVGELAALDLGVLKTLVGSKLGEQLHEFANGRDKSSVNECSERAKGYSNSTTLERDIASFEEAVGVLLELCNTTSMRMRSDGVRTACIGVTVRGNDFKDRSHQKHLDAPTDITGDIFAVCRQLFSELWDRKTPIRLLGISLTDVTSEDDLQLSWFETKDREKERKIDKTVDSIRKRFGSDSIARGVTASSFSGENKKK